MSLQTIEIQAGMIAHTILLEADLLRAWLRRDRWLRLNPIIIEDKAQYLAEEIHRESLILMSNWKLARKLAADSRLNELHSKTEWNRDRDNHTFFVATIANGLIRLCVMQVDRSSVIPKWTWTISGSQRQSERCPQDYMTSDEAKVACLETVRNLFSEWV